MALDELDRVRMALGPSDREDPTKMRPAMVQASIAIGCLSKEVTRMPLFRTGSAVMTREIAMMPSAIRYSIWSSADALRGTAPGTG